ncbi:hypothetical protein [uncultured Amaricoccus sp.]|uniref:hypothetical protein n=1 Tax=uncultured Amaricoccus sp. TaxID=339341 RepID=UPI00263137D9|nr:hypothetical protein [uncultured Amaricoccus sp.]
MATREFLANQNFGFPVVEGVEMSPVAAADGPFKSDRLNLGILGGDQPKAQAIFNGVGFP